MSARKILMTSVAVSALAAQMATATDLIGSAVNAQFAAAGWSNTATLNMGSVTGQGQNAQVAGVSVSSNLDFNVFGVGLGASSGWNYGSDTNGTDLSAGVTMTYAHDRDIDVSMIQDGSGTMVASAQSLGFLSVQEVEASGTMIEDGEIVVANAGGTLGGAVPSGDVEGIPVASASSYSATLSSTDNKFVGVVEQDNYALTLAVVNANAYSDGVSTEISGDDVSVGDTLAVSVLGNVALDIGNEYADYRDAVFSEEIGLGEGGFFDPNVGPGFEYLAYSLNPLGTILASEMTSTDDNFVVVTQLGGDANLTGIVVDGVGTINQTVSNITVMSGSIFSGITSTYTLVDVDVPVDPIP